MSKFYNKIGFLIVLVISIFGLVACDNDDDKDEIKDLFDIIVDKPVINVGYNETIEVKIVLGNGGYTVKSYDKDIAVATVSGELVTVKTGTKKGATTVQIIDQEGVIGNISVGVGEFDIVTNYPSGIELEFGASTEFRVISGNFISVEDLTIEINDPAIIRLSQIDAYRPHYTLNALKEGETTITITDRLNKQSVINVVVKPMPLELDIPSDEIEMGTLQKKTITVLKGYAPYTITSSDENTIVVQEGSNESKFGIISIGGGSSDITVTDAVGQEMTIKVTVNTSKQVAHIGTSNYFQVPFKIGGDADGTLKSMNNITFEARVYIDALNGDDNGNARINTVMGVEKIFLLRVDVRKDVSNKDERYLQLSADDKGKIRYESKTKIEVNKWYDLAVVLDGSKTGDERIKLYINGVEDEFGYKAGTPGDLKDINLTSNFFIGQSDGKRRLNGAISYARVWNKALSASEISNNVAGNTSLNSDNLVAYWAFTKFENAKSFISLSAKDFEATANSNISKWVEDPNL